MQLAALSEGVDKEPCLHQTERFCGIRPLHCGRETHARQ